MNKFVINSNDPDIKRVTDKIKLEGFREHNVEQILFRIKMCKTCFDNKRCSKCKCNPLDKIVEPISCNKQMFPNILNKEKWEDFKKEHKIEIE